MPLQKWRAVAVVGENTVETVAENFGVSAQMVRRWNGLHKGDSLCGRRLLTLHLPISPDIPNPFQLRPTNRHGTPGSLCKLPGLSPLTSLRNRVMRARSEQASVLLHKVKSGETLLLDCYYLRDCCRRP